MTKSETLKLLSIALSCFPSMMEKDMKMVGAGWHTMLGDLEFTLAQAALASVLARAKFFPTVAEIREAAVSLQPNDLPDAEVAWGEVLRATRAVGYLKTPEWSHPVIGETVKQMWGTWRRACEMMFTDTVGVDRAQFVKMYATISKRQRESALLPPMVKEIASDLARRLSLPSKIASETNGGDPE